MEICDFKSISKSKQSKIYIDPGEVTGITEMLKWQ